MAHYVIHGGDVLEYHLPWEYVEQKHFSGRFETTIYLPKTATDIITWNGRYAECISVEDTISLMKKSKNG